MFIKVLIVVLLIIILYLQYRLWYGDGNLVQLDAYQQQLEMLKSQVQEKKERNDSLYAEVLDLRKGQEAIEERARHDLGMIKEDETFFQIIE